LKNTKGELNMADKVEKHSDLRDAGIDASIPLVSKALAHFLANASPEVFKVLFGGKTILGVPSEIAAALGGGGAGLFLVKAIEYFHPTLDPRIKDRIMDVLPLVAAEFNRIVQAQGGGAGKAPSTPSAPAFVPKRLMVCDAYSGVIYLWACPANHHSVTAYEEVNAGNGKKRKEARTTPRDDCHLIATAIASALMEKEGRTPSSSDEGLNAVCICETEVVAEITRYREEKAKAEKAKVDASRPKDPPIFSHEEIRSGIRVTASAIGDAASAVGKGFAGTIRVVADSFVAAAERGEELVTALPGKAKAFDVRVTASAASFATSAKRKREINDFSWKHNIKDRDGFREHVFEQDKKASEKKPGAVFALNDLILPQMYNLFGIRS
jgi:hypothetical protein